jgi:uncharacterized membrane protein
VNSGPAEEVGKAANTFMDVMKSQPLSLALVVMNILLLILLYYIAQASKDTRRQEFDVLVSQQKEMSQLLFKCVPAEILKELQQQK